MWPLLVPCVQQYILKLHLKRMHAYTKWAYTIHNAWNRGRHHRREQHFFYRKWFSKICLCYDVRLCRRSFCVRYILCFNGRSIHCLYVLCACAYIFFVEFRLRPLPPHFLFFIVTNSDTHVFAHLYFFVHIQLYICIVNTKYTTKHKLPSHRAAILA